MDRSIFFDGIRNSIFRGKLKRIAVGNIEEIIDYWLSEHPGTPPEQLAYILATVRAEVGLDMAPVRESFAASDREARIRLAGRDYARSAGEYGHAYYGRGYVQLTWLHNYRKQSRKLGIDLVQFPDKALETGVATRILVEGMLDGDFNGEGHGLAHYINEDKRDFIEARRTVNGLDRAGEIAGYARRFLTAIQAGLAAHAEPVSKMQPSVAAAKVDGERNCFLTPKQQEKLATLLDREIDIPLVSDKTEAQVFLKVVQSIDRNIYKVVPAEITDIVHRGGSIVSSEVYIGLRENLAGFLADLIPLPFIPSFVKREILDTALNVILRALSEFTTIDDVIAEFFAFNE